MRIRLRYFHLNWLISHSVYTGKMNGLHLSRCFHCSPPPRGAPAVHLAPNQHRLGGPGVAGPACRGWAPGPTGTHSPHPAGRPFPTSRGQEARKQATVSLWQPLPSYFHFSSPCSLQPSSHEQSIPGPRSLPTVGWHPPSPQPGSRLIHHSEAQFLPTIWMGLRPGERFRLSVRSACENS